jgi:hypothetical protein
LTEPLLVVEPSAGVARRGRHARPATEGLASEAFDAEVLVAEVSGGEASPDVVSSVVAGVDLSLLATPAPAAAWSRRLEAPGAKIGVMAAGVAIVGLGGFLLLTIAGLFLG